MTIFIHLHSTPPQLLPVTQCYLIHKGGRRRGALGGGGGGGNCPPPSPPPSPSYTILLVWGQNNLECILEHSFSAFFEGHAPRPPLKAEVLCTSDQPALPLLYTFLPLCSCLSCHLHILTQLSFSVITTFVVCVFIL